MDNLEVKPTWRPGKSIWIEDDATCHHSDHHSLNQEWKRRFGEDLDTKTALEKIDDGDAMYFLMQNGYVACVSYPGNSGIHEVK